MEMEQISFAMVTLMLASTIMVSLMDTVNINGRMAIHTQASLVMVSNMVEVNGRSSLHQMELNVIATKEIMLMIRKTVKESLNGRAEIFLKVTMLMMRGMVMGKCIGLMEAFTKVCGFMEFSMVSDLWFSQKV